MLDLLALALLFEIARDDGVCVCVRTSSKKQIKKGMAAFTGEKPPKLCPANYALGPRQKIPYATLRSKYCADKFVDELTVGGRIADAKARGGVRTGVLLSIEKTKGKVGMRCIYKTDRGKKYNASKRNVYCIPPVDTFLKGPRGDWWQLMDNTQSLALIKKCLRLLPKDDAGKEITEKDVDAMFEPNNGTLLACLLVCCLLVAYCCIYCCFCCCFCFF